MSKYNLDMNSRTCPICDDPFSHVQQLVIHLAQKHDQLNDFVDKNVLENLDKSLKMKKVRRC
jgi:hypothetical protein